MDRFFSNPSLSIVVRPCFEVMKEAPHYSMQSNDKNVFLLHIYQPTNRGWQRKEIDLQGSKRRNAS